MSAATAVPLCLASASPRRRALLRQIGVPHLVFAADIDEAALPAESPEAYVQRMARAKASGVQLQRPSFAVLAADTTVVIDGEICGKPHDEAAGVAMLQRLSGRGHRVLSAVALAAGAEVAVRLSVSEVRFRALTTAECRAYWRSGEPCDKAGGYAIQGLGAVFVEALCGSYSGVMGLPLFETAQLLSAAGIPCWQGAEAPR